MGIEGETPAPTPVKPDVVLSYQRYGSSDWHIMPHTTRIEWSRAELRIELEFNRKTLDLVRDLSCCFKCHFFLQLAEEHFVDFGPCDLMGGRGIAWSATNTKQEDSVDLALVFRPSSAPIYTETDITLQATYSGPDGLSVSGLVQVDGETYPINGGITPPQD